MNELGCGLRKPAICVGITYVVGVVRNALHVAIEERIVLVEGQPSLARCVASSLVHADGLDVVVRVNAHRRDADEGLLSRRY